ncbi:hypothetical protein NEF87_000798 [Candidatus Lokiarchaeum ossiferum]|uniref:NADPH-dependent FMN reductase-like domain-containing protein n=1 Tax=Candidatus Lokiarchaeum ossiferum TaxID=2951803 RepID=A0ABY6HLX7_9ARCH|nr:hypothetical protein NEF87_000798 [Candidatus Lokiarchaeum sp. B-35]
MNQILESKMNVKGQRNPKIVAICGSPRKGLTKKALDQMRDLYPDINLKILMLKDLSLKPCLGCYSCVLKGEDRCPLKDDRKIILQDMIDADGVIFASPVFVNTITAMMKNFFERLGYLAHRPVFFEKYAMVMSVCGGFGTEPANKYMQDIAQSFGFNVVNSLELKYSSRSEKEHNYNLQFIKKAMVDLLNGINTQIKTKPTITQVVMFNLFKYISSVKKDYFSADYEYYKSKSGFFDERKINFFYNWIAKQQIKKFKKDFVQNR